MAARPHAVGHRLDGASTIALRTPNNDTRIWPAGYLWTNAADMSRALSALVSRGAVAGQRGLPPSVIARVSTPHAPMPNIFVDGHYGYGLMIFRDRNTLMFEHGGTNARLLVDRCGSRRIDASESRFSPTSTTPRCDGSRSL